MLTVLPSPPVLPAVNHWGYFIYLNWMPTYFYKVLGEPDLHAVLAPATLGLVALCCWLLRTWDLLSNAPAFILPAPHALAIYPGLLPLQAWT
jgi:hypothetical protein